METLRGLLYILGLTLMMFGLIKITPDLKLGKPFGIPFTVKGSFIGWVAVLAFAGGLETLFCILLAYVAVVIHEFTHALTAEKFGYKTVSINIWPMSGVASITGDWNTNPWHEFAIAIAGPLSNVVQFLIVLPLAILLDNKWVTLFATINISLCFFNLLPIYPMDGGRVLHSFLGKLFRGDVLRVSKWTAIVSFALSLILTPFFFYNGDFLVPFILMLVVTVGMGEHRAVYEREVNRRKRFEILLRLVGALEELVQVELKESEHENRTLALETCREKLAEARKYHGDNQIDKADILVREVCTFLGVAPQA